MQSCSRRTLPLCELVVMEHTRIRCESRESWFSTVRVCDVVTGQYLDEDMFPSSDSGAPPLVGFALGYEISMCPTNPQLALVVADVIHCLRRVGHSQFALLSQDEGLRASKVSAKTTNRKENTKQKNERRYF